jgi:hypothetical protein
LKRYAARSRYHLCLAHLILEEGPYFQFYKETVERGEYVIMDNSIIELHGEPMPNHELLRAIDLLHPTEFVCQDFPRDPATTHFWAMNKAPELKKRYPDMKLMVVPQWGQGRVFEDWWASFMWLRNLPFIDTIGLPKFIRGGRLTAAERLEEEPLLRLDKEFHLLGTWSNPLEVEFMTRYKWIRGVDSKAPVRFGQYGVALHPKDGLLADFREAIPPLNFDRPDDPMPVITDHNVRTYLNWARGKQDAKVLQFPKGKYKEPMEVPTWDEAPQH